MADVNFSCGVCERAQPIGTPYHRIRLAVEDYAHSPHLPVKQKPGLYACCQKCWDLFLPAVAKRVGKAVEDMEENDAV